MAGRPTEYKQEYCEQMLSFFKKERYRKEEIPTETTGTTEKTGDISKTVIKFEYKANDLPTFQAFAEIIGVSRQTLDNWAKANSEFFDTYEICKGIQEDFLVQNGLLGLYQPNYAKFIAQNYTGLKDESDLNVKTNNFDINSLSISELQEQIAKLEQK